MKLAISLSVFVVVGAAASTSMAAWQPSYWRCAADQFPYSGPSYTLSQRMALGRTQWARTARNNTGDGAYWDTALDADVTTAATTYNMDIYPVYMDTASPMMTTWVGPGPNATGTMWGNTYALIASRPYGPTVKPAAVQVAGLCEPGCYMPEQRIRFSSGDVPIVDAYKSDMRQLVTLAPNATFDALRFMNNEVARYTVDIAPANQEILTLRMASGGELQVTTEHPLLTSEGVMKKAKDIAIGEDLMRDDGSPDIIISVERKTVFTKVYNLRPTTTDLTSNILIAQGYLNGSHRYQSEFLSYMNRVILRRQIPQKLIPRQH